MFSTRRRRRALVLVGIGCVGVPRRAARPRRPRVDAFNGSTFFPSSTGHPRGASPRHRRACQFQRAFPGCSRVSSLHCTTRRTRSAGAALAYGARLAYLASLERTRRGMPSRKRPPPRGPRRWKGRSRRRGIPGRRHPRDRRRYQKHHQTRRRVALPSPRRARRTTTSVLRRAIGFRMAGRRETTSREPRRRRTTHRSRSARRTRRRRSRREERPRSATRTGRTRDGEASAPPPPPRRLRLATTRRRTPLLDSSRETEREPKGNGIPSRTKHSSLGTTPCRPTSSARRAGSRWPRWTRRNLSLIHI